MEKHEAIENDDTERKKLEGTLLESAAIEEDTCGVLMSAFFLILFSLRGKVSEIDWLTSLRKRSREVKQREREEYKGDIY